MVLSTRSHIILLIDRMVPWDWYLCSVAVSTLAALRIHVRCGKLLIVAIAMLWGWRRRLRIVVETALPALRMHMRRGSLLVITIAVLWKWCSGRRGRSLDFVTSTALLTWWWLSIVRLWLRRARWKVLAVLWFGRS